MNPLIFLIKSCLSAQPRLLFILLGTVLMLPSQAASQVVLLEETFDNDSLFTGFDGDGNPISLFSDGASSYLGLTDGAGNSDFGGDPPPTGLGSYSNHLGSFLAAEDLDAGGQALPLSLIWSDLDITGIRRLELDMFLASRNDTSFESGDFLRMEFSVDDGVFFTVLEIRADANGIMRLDTDLDGLGDGFALSDTMENVYTDVLVDGSSLDLRLSISADEVNEDFAVDCFLLSAAQIHEWTLPATGSFFNAGNWSPGTVPSSTDQAVINNGGLAAAEAPTTGPAPAVEVADLIIGDALGTGAVRLRQTDLTVLGRLSLGGQIVETAPGSGTFDDLQGTLTLADGDSISVDEDFDIGQVWAFGTAEVQSTAVFDLVGYNAMTVGDQLDIAGSVPQGAATAGVDVTFNARDLGTLDVGSDLDVCDGDPVGSPAGTATGNCAADVSFTDVGTLIVGDDLEIGDALADQDEKITTTASVLFLNINDMTVANDFEICSSSTDGVGPRAGESHINARARVERSTLHLVDNLDVGRLDVTEDGKAEVIAALELVDATWSSDAGSRARIGYLSGGRGSTDNSLDAALILLASSMTHSGDLIVGSRQDSTPGTLDAKLTLLLGSALTTDHLNLDTEGTLRLVIDGLTSIFDTGRMAGNPYSAIRADDALLAGKVEAKFEFLPPAGTHSFDLVTSASAGALADTTAELTVLGLDPGFNIDFFGVVTETVDVLRLTISGTPARVDLDVQQSNNVDAIVAGTQVIYTVEAANFGPADEPTAVVTDVFPAETACSWTSIASDGASGNSNGAGPMLHDTLNLPSGNVVTYTITCDVAASAGPTLSNTFSISGSIVDDNPANNSMTETDPVIAHSDLGITLDDLEVTALPGDLRIYTLVASNAGPSDASGSTVTDLFPPQLTGCSWECTAEPGAQCAPGIITGNLIDTPLLPAGSSVTYTAGCVVDPELDPTTEAVINMATIAPAAEVTDLNPDNNSALDDNAGPAVVLFRDGFESGDLNAWSFFLPQP